MRRSCLFVLLSLFQSACHGNNHALAPRDAGTSDAADAGGRKTAGPTYKFSPEVVARGCAKALACANQNGSITQGLSRCVQVLTEMGGLDWNNYRFLVEIGYDDYDWLLFKSLMQNMACVEAASGCSQILACLNQGQAQPTCTSSDGYSRHPRCSDDRHLQGCSLNVGASYDCSELGLPCLETLSTEGTSALATCAAPAGANPPADTTVEVTCDGDVASFAFAGKYTFDCGYLGSTCVAGNYALDDLFTYCQGTGAACDPKAFTPRCDGNTWVLCLGGRETGKDCTGWGAICGAVPTNVTSRCGFACANTSEDCQAGVISYCGPNGMTTLDCRSLGFADCKLDTAPLPYSPAEAWCVP